MLPPRSREARLGGTLGRDRPLSSFALIMFPSRKPVRVELRTQEGDGCGFLCSPRSASTTPCSRRPARRWWAYSNVWATRSIFRWRFQTWLRPDAQQLGLPGGGRRAGGALRRDFGDAEVVVCPSSSCVSTVRSSYPRLAATVGDGELGRRMEALGSRVFEFSDFLVNQLGIDDVGAYYPHRVTYHPTCNSLRGLKVGDAPMRLLHKVRALEADRAAAGR